MRLFKKQLVVLTLNVLVFFSFFSAFPSYNTSYLEGQAEVNERSFKLTGITAWNGTLPTTSTYVNLTATSNNCGFSLSGNANKPDANSTFGINTPSNSLRKLIITKPSYIVEFTGIRFEAYSSSTTARYFKINGVTDSVDGITSSYTFSSPLQTSIISTTGSSITIESTEGAIVIKSITLYFY